MVLTSAQGVFNRHRDPATPGASESRIGRRDGAKRLCQLVEAKRDEGVTLFRRRVSAEILRSGLRRQLAPGGLRQDSNQRVSEGGARMRLLSQNFLDFQQAFPPRSRAEVREARIGQHRLVQIDQILFGARVPSGELLDHT